MPKNVETDASPRRGKGLCAPVMDKSLLSKSKTGSIAVFRAAGFHVATCVAVHNGSAPNSAFAATPHVLGSVYIVLAVINIAANWTNPRYRTANLS